MPKSFLLVALGGALGAVARYSVYQFLKTNPPEAVWLNTWFINLLGCFLIGICWVAFPQTDWYLLVATGILGGFTTFSAFGLETYLLVKEGLIGKALLYSSGAVLGGTLLAWLGVLFGKLIFRV